MSRSEYTPDSTDVSALVRAGRAGSSGAARMAAVGSTTSSRPPVEPPDASKVAAANVVAGKTISHRPRIQREHRAAQRLTPNCEQDASSAGKRLWKHVRVALCRAVGPGQRFGCSPAGRNPQESRAEGPFNRSGRSNQVRRSRGRAPGLAAHALSLLSVLRVQCRDPLGRRQSACPVRFADGRVNPSQNLAFAFQALLAGDLTFAG